MKVLFTVKKTTRIWRSSLLGVQALCY